MNKLLAVLVSLASAVCVSQAGQGAGRMLYSAPSASFIEKTSGETIVTVNDASGSIATLQSSIDTARAANPTSVIVVRLLKGATYSVNGAGLVLGSHECLVVEGAILQAASSSITVPLITIASGSSNVSVAGGTLDGGGANINGIYAPAAARVNIDKVTVKNCGQDCILLKGQGNSTYDNEMTVTRCEAFGSAVHAGISIQNSTQTAVIDNFCHNSLVGIYLSCAWANVANNVCNSNSIGIQIAGGSDNAILNNTCNNNGTGILAAGSNNMIISDALGGNTTAGISSTGTGSTFADNLFASDNNVNFSNGGSGNHVIAYKTPLNAPGQDYFYPPLINDQHTNAIVNNMGRTDVTISSTTIDSVQSQYNSARAANPNDVIVLHLNGTFTVGAAPLTLQSNTCVLLNGLIQIDASTGASQAINGGSTPQHVSISGGTIDGSNLTGNNAIYIANSTMLQVDAMTLQNFGPSNPRVGSSDVLRITGGATPQIVTRCSINGGAARGMWFQTAGVKRVVSDCESTAVNQDGVDFDSSTSQSIVKFCYCHDLVRYGVFFEQSAARNVAIGNVCNNCSRDINIYNNSATPRGDTAFNSVLCNALLSNNGLRNGSTGTNIVQSSHNFLFNNTVVNASINSELYGTENYYSQNYQSGGSLSTAGSESFFNSSDVSSNQFLRDANSGLFLQVKDGATTNNAPVVIGMTNGLGGEQWALVPVDSGFYQLKNKRSGLAMAVNGAATNAGAPVIQFSFGSGKNDQWMPMSAGNGFWYLLNRRSGLCLNVPDATAGTQLDQQPYIGGANQQFMLSQEAIIGVPLPFSLSVSPASQSILAGSNAVFTVNVTTNAGFTGAVSLSVSGLPANATGTFNPVSRSDSGVSVLTVTTTTNTPAGNFPLTITGTNGANASSVSVALSVSSSLVANPGTLVWVAASGVDTNWSSALNWTNVTSGGYGPPGPSNDVKFFDPGATAGISNINNVVNGSVAIASLQFANTNGNHTTWIDAGQFLKTGSLTVGTEVDGTNTQTIFTTVTGPGALQVTNTSGNLIVRQGVATAGGNQALRAVLDLSGLDSFTATIGTAKIGALGANARPSGTLYLARSNAITASGTSPAIEIGGHGGGSGNAGNASFLFLGQQNYIFANGISVGNVKQGGSAMWFNPAFNNPSAVFRAADGVSAVPTWFIADSQSQSGTVNTTATNDFTGGTVDALVNTLTIARSSTGSGVGNPLGLLAFSAGAMTINNLRIGYQGASGANFSTATVNVNDDALLNAGTIELAHVIGGSGATNTSGTLNLNGGTLMANNVVSGGGTANVTVNSGTVVITNTSGPTMSGLTSLALSSGNIHVPLNGNSVLTNIVTTSLVADGVTIIDVDSLSNVIGTNRFPLIQYSNFAGATTNFSIGDLPQGFGATLSNNSVSHTIELVVFPLPILHSVITAITLSGTTLTLSGTNGSPGMTYSVFSATNIALPFDSWTLEASDVFNVDGNFSITVDVNLNHSRQFYLLKSP